MKEKIKREKTKEEILEEIKHLAQRADESSNHQLDLFKGQNLGDEDIDIGFDASIIDDTADPKKSYILYYGIQRLLIDYLPKGPKNKRLRQYVYDEKNLFLNRGMDKDHTGRRGSDGRMTYISSFLQTAFNTVANWVSSGANAFDIYQAFWNLNEEKGYHKKRYSENTFDRNLEGLLNTPPPQKAEEM